MKKYTMIFVSAILVLTTLLIPNQYVRAEELETQVIDYETWGEQHFGNLSDELSQLVTYLESLGSDYYYYIYASNNSIDLYLFKNLDNYNSLITPYICYSLSSTSVGLSMGIDKTYAYGIKVYFQKDGSDFSSKFESLKENVSNDNFTKTKNFGIGASSIYDYYFNTSKAIVYATNIDNFYLRDTSVYSLTIDNTTYRPGAQLPTYYEYKYSKKIDISSGYICDLEGRDAEYVTIDFNDYANENYTYQYGIKRQSNIEYIDWHNIENMSNYIHNFNEYYDGTIIYARVLDNEGNEISKNQYRINNAELPKFDLIINSGLACPIPNYEGDPQAEIINVDFRNVYFENYKYYYTYDTRTKYQINVTSEQLTHQIVEYLYNFIYFYIYDENDNLIYYTYNDVTSEDRLGYLPDDYEIRHNIEFSDGVACDLENNKIINVKFDFSNITKYVNHYNFDVVINGEHFGAIQYHEIVLNEQNYIQDFEVKIYIDTNLYLSGTYRVGGLLGKDNFEDTYNDMLNNGNWNENLDVKNIEDMGDLVIQFLGAISTFISTFFDLLDFFFQRLNFWIRACIITLFVELVICKIIKGVKK